MSLKNILQYSPKIFYLSQPRDGSNVTVAHRGHGDHHPVDAGGDGGEAWVLALLNEEAEAGEGEAGDEDQHEHEPQLSQGLSDGVNDGLETRGVTTEFEYPRQFEDTEHLKDILT